MAGAPSPAAPTLFTSPWRNRKDAVYQTWVPSMAGTRRGSATCCTTWTRVAECLAAGTCRVCTGGTQTRQARQVSRARSKQRKPPRSQHHKRTHPPTPTSVPPSGGVVAWNGPPPLASATFSPDVVHSLRSAHTRVSRVHYLATHPGHTRATRVTHTAAVRHTTPSYQHVGRRYQSPGVFDCGHAVAGVEVARGGTAGLAGTVSTVAALSHATDGATSTAHTHRHTNSAAWAVRTRTGAPMAALLRPSASMHRGALRGSTAERCQISRSQETAIKIPVTIGDMSSHLSKPTTRGRLPQARGHRRLLLHWERPRRSPEQTRCHEGQQTRLRPCLRRRHPLRPLTWTPSPTAVHR